ncbi:MAG: hypothetical protein QOI40_2070 [Alphaproteobacteria bacterium]|jgi:hypothetical protein|nr:hypothetical protein [Alphaproteobacteria bacterium]
MLHRSSTSSIVLAAALMLATAGAKAHDEAKYPDWNGQWFRHGSAANVPFDPAKPLGRGQQAPLTPEYQAKFEASLADQAAGGNGLNAHTACLPRGMPRIMNAVYPMEFIILPKTTYILFEDDPPRRIYTDGRDWPGNPEPAFAGYSIGKWIDEEGNGRYGVLEIETRYMKGPRAYDVSGLPLHEDNQTVLKERIYLDKSNPDVLHDEIMTIDHALTHPWTVTKNYRRERNPRWFPNDCTEDNHHVTVGKEDYFVSSDGYLMPVKKDQPPPDLKYFKQSRK